MYLSTNSRYVLHRAYLLTPSTYILKGAEKLLSIKLPSDDPSKPALRVNIPQESSHSSSTSKLMSNADLGKKSLAEPRSKSLVSTRTPFLNSNFQGDALSKCDSESQLSLPEAGELLAEKDDSKDLGSTTLGSCVAETAVKTSASENHATVVANEDDYQEGLTTPLNDPTTGEALANSYVNSRVFSESERAEIKSEVPLAVNNEARNQRVLYIIVDPLEKSIGNIQCKNAFESCKKEEEKPPPSMVQDDFGTLKVAPQKVPVAKTTKSKVGSRRAENASSRKSKSFPKMAARGADVRQSAVRFEVQEVEDPGTYVLHSKPGKDNLKSFRVECVPEKEFTTRSGSTGSIVAPLRVHGSPGISFKGLQNEVASVEELPSFVKVPDGRKKPKSLRSDSRSQKADKAKAHAVSRSVHPSASPVPVEKNKAPKPFFSEPSYEADLSSQESLPEYLHSPVDVEKGKSVSEFLKDDFDSVRSTLKPADLKMAGPVLDGSTPKEPEAFPKASESAGPQEPASGEHSQSAAEAKPQYNLTKAKPAPIDKRKETSKKNERTCDYYSPWKDNSKTPRDRKEREARAGKQDVKKVKRASKKRGSYAESRAPAEKVEPENPNASEKCDPGANFKSSGSFVSIGCDKAPCLTMKFSAAFPPLLCEALRIRGRILGFRREFLFSDKWSWRFDFAPKCSHMTPKGPPKKSKVDLSENSILFPKAETEKFDCSSLFGEKDEVTLGGRSDSAEGGGKSPKISDNIANIANESLTDPKGQPSVDSLSLMKKVKEMVELDLENAIKIFKKVEGPEETSSVVVRDGDQWRVDTEALEMCAMGRKEQASAFDGVGRTGGGERSAKGRIQEIPQQAPMYLPPRRGSEYDVKLSDFANSVVVFNPLSNEFFVNKEALAKAIRQRADESFDDVIVQTLEGQLTRGRGNESIVMFDARGEVPCEMKGGDSILVFDEETQNWKVDYSILEKREQQLRIEEELNRRSELILETIEQLEKGRVPSVPMPESKEKKIFDYSKEEWKSYPTEKISGQKPAKSKLPFKGSNAEEIRRNNSDLYDNLFMESKKETTSNKNDNSGQTNKGSKSCSSNQEKKASDGGSEKEPRMSKEAESKAPTSGSGGGKPCDPGKEEDNFWESFLNMNILPRDISELPKTIRSPPPPPPPPKPTPPMKDPPQPPPIPPPKPPPQPTVLNTTKTEPKPPPPPQPTTLNTTKKEPKTPPQPTTLNTTKKEPTKKPTPIPVGRIDEPRHVIQGRRIEESRFRIQMPHIGDRKIEDSKLKIPLKETPKTDPKKKPPEPTASSTKQETKIKVPVKETPKVEDPKKKPPEPTVSSIKQETQIKVPVKEAPKVEDPKKKPPEPTVSSIKQETQIKVPVKEAPKVEDPKKKPEEPTVSPTKQETQIKVPVKEVPKVEDPKKKPPEPTVSPIKQETQIKAPTKETPKVEDPKKKPPEGPPTASGDSKPSTKASIQPEVDEPKNPKSSPTIGSPKTSPKQTLSSLEAPETSPKEEPTTTSLTTSSQPSAPAVRDPNPPTGGKKDKSAADHYISENIVEISRNTTKETPPKYKTNKIETVKLNITSDKRMPSKVTEINLNKKCEEKGKEKNATLTKKTPSDSKKPSDEASKKKEKCSIENRTFYKNFEKYKTPFSDPEYEEKSMKIKSDIESNPNLKKLDNWNKTLVLHDVGKPPENMETWLKDETDKMATLLLKVLQDAADGKPRKKQPLLKPKPGDKLPGKSAVFDAPQKKCETTPDNFLFRIRTVNLSLENDKIKPTEDRKPYQKPKDFSAQPDDVTKPFKVIDSPKLFSQKEAPLPNSTSSTPKTERSSPSTEIQKSRFPHATLNSMEPATMPKELDYHILPLDITEEVPGPEFLKKLSHAWKVFPVIGSQMTIFTLLRAFQLMNFGSSLFGSYNPDKTRVDAFSKLFSRYGPIVNVQGPLSGNVVLVHKPEHFNAVFEQDSLTSIRSVFDSLDQCRREAEDKLLTAAISTDWSKPDWTELKRGTTDPLLKGSERFFEPADFSSDSLINSIRKTRNMQNLVSEDFMEEIKRWSLEGICNVLFEKSFSFLDRKDSNGNWIMEPDKLYMAVQEATSCLNKCEKGFQTWRLMATPSSVGLSQAYRSISNMLSKQLYQAELSLKSKSEGIKERNMFLLEDLTFVESMLLNDGMTAEEVTCNLIDIILLGTNMMNSALGFLLYDLAQNVRVQNKLLEELQTALPDKNGRFNYQSVQSLKYLQACLKESLRLHIPVPVLYRMLQNDILLSNYIIPKGTYLVMDLKVNCMKDQIFDDPERFVPERWMNEEKWMRDVHPFDTFPLCHGPRAELAKRIVEMQLSTCLAKVVRNFKIEYHYGEIEGTNTFISVPDKPLKLNFTERDS